MPTYPYYLAITYEGRFKGQYPAQLGMIPSLRNKWDSGGFGTGKRVAEELQDTKLQGLLNQLLQQGINWRYDDVDIYVVSAPGRPRQKMNSHEIMQVLQRPPETKEN